MQHSKGLYLGATGLVAASLTFGFGSAVAWADPTAGHGHSAAAPGQQTASPGHSGNANSGKSSQAGGQGGSASGGSSSSAGGAPPGNNGTVKIDEYSMDPGQDGDAHVACGFSVSFFGYDSGAQSASISVTPVAPTTGGSPYSTSTTWDKTRTSGSQFDANVPVSAADLSTALTGVTPQPQQGYHLRLEVEVTGSRGSNDKYKVFWMQPCPTTAPVQGGTTGTSGGTPSTPSTPSTPTVTPTSGTATGASTTASGSSVVPVAVAAATSPVDAAKAVTAPAKTAAASAVTDASPLTALTSSGPVPVARPADAIPADSGSLAFTGADITGLGAAGLGLIGAGLLLTRRWRRPAPVEL